jgi:uncharacterized protein (TIGR02145 family)
MNKSIFHRISFCCLFLCLLLSSTFLPENPTPTVQIGKQTWMLENLNVDHFKNGDKILQAKTDEEWFNADKNRIPAWCYYDNDSINGKKFGKLYNEYAVFDKRGLAPEGWHIPSNPEWEELANFLGGRDVAGGALKETGIKNWSPPNEGATNSTGFTALPTGVRLCDRKGNVWFENLDFHGIYWTSTRDGITAEIRKISSNNARLGGFGWSGGFGVRCLKN